MIEQPQFPYITLCKFPSAWFQRKRADDWSRDFRIRGQRGFIGPSSHHFLDHDLDPESGPLTTSMTVTMIGTIIRK